ncbi:hypothetical protein QFC19_008734 [Naganishia cerealis]|uniref:Uncharacterized protein n=1 Tax=Naganishia cerealis TaxID=610337 RepID=A0ACC2UZJ9_9TREE|nr:hypothetical protein QFC19_008734 [Naganishia cerealis]
MSGVGAIDLTLSLSDSDDDDVPIFLSSSRYTPLRSVSAEFEVIGEITPAGNQSASETQRSRNRSPVTPSKGKALKTVAASSSASSERPIEHIYEELNIGETSPVRPRPRRRKRPVVEDEPVARSTTPDSLPPEPSPLALPEPDLLQQVKVAAEEVDILEQVQSRVQMECVEEISAHKSSSQEPTEGRSLCDASAELDGLNDEASIYLPSREPTPAMQVDSEDLLADASTQLVSQIEQQSKGVVEWQVLEELLLDTSGLSISLPSEDEASQLDLIPEESVIGEASGSRSASMAQEVDSRSVQATVAAALMDIHCPLKSPPTSRTDACVPPLTSGESVSPIASRIGLRNRKKSVEMEMVGQRGLNTRTASPVSPALIPNEASTPRTSLLSATSSHFSNISSASSQTFERGSVRRRGGVSARVRASLFEAEQNDLTSTRPESRSEQSVSSGDKQHNADRHTPTLEGEHSFVREAQRTIAIEDDWSILPAYKTPKTTTPSRRSQNYAVKSLETTPQSKKWGSTDAVDVESSNTTSTTRRGTRVRKATQKLGDFVPLGEILRKSPRSSQIESGNTLARQSTLVAENGHSAATLLMQVITPSTDASFNLSRVSPPAHAQETLPASPSESKRSDSGRWRRSERDVSIASTPTSAVSIVKKPRLRLKLISTPKQNQVVPFPPAGLPAESNEYLSTQDLEDMTLMAIFAVLNEAGNKAMGATEIAETYATHDWMQKKSPMTPLDVYTTLRNYLKRTAFAQRKSLIAKQTLQGTSAEAYLKPGLHPDVAARANRNGYTRGCVWYLEGKYGSSHWESPFASLRPEKEKIHLRAPQSKTQSRRASKAKLVQPPPLQSAPKRSEVISRPGQQSKPDQRPNQLRRWASSYRYTSSASSRKSVTSSESEEEEGEDLEICKLDDDEEHLIPDANEYSAGSDMNQSVSALDIDIDSVSHSDSASHTESDTQFEAVRQLCKMSLKQSPVPARTTAIPIAESAVRDDEGRAVIQVITSAGSDTAVFPDNPLKPFRWEHGPIASSGSFSFNDSPPEDILHLSNDSDVVMKDVENERAVSYPSKMPFSFERNIDQMSLWNEERALFSEPPDLIDEDFEAISTTPTSSKDSDILADTPYLRDVTLSGDREDWTEHLLDMEETSDGSLIKVARVLGRLLPSGHNMLDAIIHDPNSPTTNYTARRRSGHGRSSFFSHRKPSTVPLGLPTRPPIWMISTAIAVTVASTTSRTSTI